ncbi:GNAT family N-acetyltransferase [Natronobacterium texcoconense]|uniref:Protein N-acetyltransferase, RimJ/RimL family n=1 Tax=Natronobacterium texcoconense TaxID=1095778 RepID=A0A1H1CH27_NATTX|nr:GNAT family protein [Natronobacterium texcoconense]SDQ63430.1 Protein N-acetyltransferase, RimJ/RimL family [Natronobacterium texcoconense]
MGGNLYPERIETDRLVLERLCHDTVDPFEFYEFVTRDDWQGEATDHMPWFRLRRLDQVERFVDRAEEIYADREGVRYLLRTNDETRPIVGTSAYKTEWETKRATTDIVLAKEYWGREYALERASIFVELTFEVYDLEAYYTTCAADNEPSRRSIEKCIEQYGGRHEGLLRQHSPRPNGDVTDQHRFSIVRGEYEEATVDRETLECEIDWE